MTSARRNRQQLLRDGLLAFVCTGFVALAIALVAVSFRAGHARSDARDANAANTVNHQAVQALAAQVTALGATPVVQPSTLPGAPGPKGAAGARGPGPTATQVSDAVAVYCAGHDGCTSGPTAAQVAVAIRGFCAAGQCRGAPGDDATGAPGAAGQPGQNGRDGAAGPGPTDDQLAAAVVSYCSAHDNCAGPAGGSGSPGPTGPPGAPGADGRGVTSIDCNVLLGTGTTFTFHYSDGSSQTVDCTGTVGG